MPNPSKCRAMQANKMPVKDKKAVGIWPLSLLKAEEKLLFQAFDFLKMHELKSECRSVRVRGVLIVLKDPMYFSTKWLPPSYRTMLMFLKILLMCFTFLLLTCSIFIVLMRPQQYLDLNC